MAQQVLKAALRACVREKVAAMSPQDRASESVAIAAKVRDSLRGEFFCLRYENRREKFSTPQIIAFRPALIANTGDEAREVPGGAAGGRVPEHGRRGRHRRDHPRHFPTGQVRRALNLEYYSPDWCAARQCFVPRYTADTMELYRVRSEADIASLPRTKWGIRQPEGRSFTNEYNRYT